MPDFDKKNKDLPHITLRADNSTRIRGVGFGSTAPIDKPIEKSKFIDKLNNLIDLNTVKLESIEKTYFLLELNLPYYNPEVQSLFKRLKLEQKSIMGEFRVLVSSNKERLKAYIDKGNIHKSTLKVIRDIHELESSNKIGKSLQNIIKSDVDRKRALQIFIQLIKLDDEERKVCIEELKNKLYSEKSIYFYRESLFISCICSTAKIKEIAEIPFVKLITEAPKPQNIETSGDIILSKKEILLENKSPTLKTPICIIDSGISEVLENFVIKKENMYSSFDNQDNKNHGTGVASVAIFGEQLLDNPKKMAPETNIISYKIDDLNLPDNKINLAEAIMDAVRKYKEITPIFNLSYNYDEIPVELREETVNLIDKFIQKENVIVVNSAGNIPLDLCYMLKDNYPRYLTNHNVYCPAECRNIFSVGSINNQSSENEIIYSKHTRLGISPLVQNSEVDKYEFFKPEIHSFGGDSKPDDVSRSNILDETLAFPIIDNKGNLIMDVGTSYSAPLISLCFARLYDKFKGKLKNSETYKAIVLNQCIRKDCEGIPTFSLVNTKSVGNCNDGIYLNFEGISGPHEKSEEKKRSQIIKCKKIKFYVPSEAESIDVVVAHSNNYDNQIVNNMNTKVILKLAKPSGTACKKSYGNIGKKSAITFSHYDFTRNYEGEWEAELHIETHGIPKEIFDKIEEIINGTI